MNRNHFFCLAAAILSCTFTASGWGQKGHDVTCAIAQQHLTRKTAKKVSAILDGKSLVYWANWMDDASHTKEYAYTSTWHYRNVDEGETYENCKLNPKGDVLTAIDAQIKALKSGELNKEQEALALKMLIHFVGDLHCPMHMGHLSDRGGNNSQVRLFNKGTNLHSVWDSGVVDALHKWGYEEWAREIDTADKKEVATIVSGTPSEWGMDTYALATAIYAATPVGTNISYDYLRDWGHIAEQQLLCGGLRLAAILNDIF